MAEHAGEKTEKPTGKRLEEALSKGMFPRSAEVQTVFVLVAAVVALTFSGTELWQKMAGAMAGILGHLGEMDLTESGLQNYAARCGLFVGNCLWPITTATIVGGLLAGGLQNRFRTSGNAVQVNWERLNIATGFQRVFSTKSLVPTCISICKLLLIGTLTFSVIKSILGDPIFYSVVDVARIAGFMADSAYRILMRVIFALVLIGSVDYGYQFWKTNKELMMTKEEVKDETKNSEGSPEVKQQRRRRYLSMRKRKMLMEVPHADVIVTNPTHLAVALRYDRKTMKAPKIVAKGSRLNALKIREIAAQHQIPIIENKPLARMMFKYGKVGGEIPAELYSAVAEVLAWVYRVNAYRYYREQSMA